MRPLDELPDAAAVTVLRNQAMTWIRDSTGVEYAVPPWLVAVIDEVCDEGYREAQREMREAMGFVHVKHSAGCEACGQGEDGKAREVTNGG